MVNAVPSLKAQQNVPATLGKYLILLHQKVLPKPSNTISNKPISKDRNIIGISWFSSQMYCLTLSSCLKFSSKVTELARSRDLGIIKLPLLLSIAINTFCILVYKYDLPANTDEENYQHDFLHQVAYIREKVLKQEV